EHIAPVAEHIEDDAATFGLLIVPARPLCRLTPISLEHPVSEFSANREHASEEAGVAQHPDLAQAGQNSLSCTTPFLTFLILTSLATAIALSRVSATGFSQ